jgi:tetratricopeptide (TPR) repeat protein
MRKLPFAALAVVAAAATIAELEKARDQQDRATLERIAAEWSGLAEKTPNDAKAQYNAAVAQSIVAEVALEMRDRGPAKAAAEAGIRKAERAVALKPRDAEYHRILGTLCGQVIPANVLAVLKYGKCAQEEISKAIELDPKSARAYLSRGVGNFYLPPALGGGAELAIKDFEKALSLNPKLAEAHVWLGVALRKAGRNSEARSAFSRAVEINPARVWARQQLEKTPSN